MITYQKRIPSKNDPDTAKKIVLQTLLPLSFEIANDFSGGVSVNGPGYQSTRQPPLLGISTAVFDFGRAEIKVDAELGGISQITRILLTVLIGVGVLDASIFIVLWFYIEAFHDNPWFLMIPPLTLLPWIVIAPIITRFIRRRCEDAIDTLLRNAGGSSS